MDEGGGECCDTCCEGGWFARAEAVVVQPVFSRNVAFTLEDPIAPLDESIVDIEHDWDLKASPRFELGYLNPCTSFGWRTRYWHFDQSTSTSAQNVDGSVIIGFDDGDIDIGIDGVDDVVATHELELHVVDLELMKQCGCWTYSGGVRCTRMDQNYVDIVMDYDFEGLGPTVAAEASYGLPCWNLGVFGIFRGSILAGEMSSFTVNGDASTFVIHRSRCKAQRTTNDFWSFRIKDLSTDSIHRWDAVWPAANRIPRGSTCRASAPRTGSGCRNGSWRTKPGNQKLSGIIFVI